MSGNIEQDEMEPTRYNVDPIVDAIYRKNVPDLKQALLNAASENMFFNDDNDYDDSSQYYGEEVSVHRHLSVYLNYQESETFQSPLLLAIGPEPVHTQMVKTLLQIDYDDDDDDNGDNHLRNLQLLVDLEQGDGVHGIKPLFKACLEDNPDIVELLLNVKLKAERTKYANQNYCHQRLDNPAAASTFIYDFVNTRPADGKTPLIHMAKRGNLKLIKLLLKYGANVRLYDQQAMNALMHACAENHIHVVQYLLQRTKIDVNEYKVDTAIWYASAHGNAEIVQLLIGHGAELEYRLDGTIYSSTPLMEACEWGHYGVVQVLLEHGADPDNATGRKALKLAETAGYQRVVDLMKFWTRRLVYLKQLAGRPIAEGSVVSTKNISPKLLPLILCMTAKQHDMLYRIIYSQGDLLSDHMNREKKQSLYS